MSTKVYFVMQHWDNGENGEYNATSDNVVFASLDVDKAWEMCRKYELMEKSYRDANTDMYVYSKDVNPYFPYARSFYNVVWRNLDEYGFDDYYYAFLSD